MKYQHALRENDVGGSRSHYSRQEILKIGLLALAGAAIETPLYPSVGQAKGSRIRFGLNYLPRRHWWYTWQDWDRAAISEDLHAIADLGMDHIRIQCVWPLVQPGISYVSPLAVEGAQELLSRLPSSMGG